MAGKGQSLVIVESPAKAKTINRILGSSYVVKASMGHVRDLPETKLGVDIDHDFKPHYVLIRGKAKVVKALKSAASKADRIFLAPDMDREGEAIAWHLANLIGKNNKKIRRVIFNEVTEKGIKQAFANPTDIDMRKVNAQQARRVLDRLVGYLVSPLLWKVVHRGASAGRVQSVALRLICEREEEIQKFVPRKYWTIECKLQSERGETFTARLDRIGKAKGEVDSIEKARQIELALKSKTFKVTKVTRKNKRRNPKPPYITSTLQQDAARRLGFSARKTMVVAQELYEGIDLGEKERVGLITYMRTDSVRIAADACDAAKAFIKESYGEAYVPARSTQFRKPKSSQDAHEAIRPTDVARIPGQIARYLTKDQLKLYELIWARFLASQMSPAVFDVTTIEIGASGYTLKVTGSVMNFDGFLKVYPEKVEEGPQVPDLTEGETLKLLDVKIEEHETQPPPHYTEASLIKELEEKGIGRPSTYATIISTILERGYVEKVRGSLVPTELGNIVLRILLKTLPDIFEVGFTARMESQLDKIESGEDNWVKVVKEFYEPFRKSLEKANAMRRELKDSISEYVDETCEICGKPMVKKWGRHGKFLACSGFPKCKNTKPIEEEIHVDAKCPECGGEMVVRTGKYGKFLACRRYPECKGTRPFTLGIKCPEGCGGELKEKRTKKGRIFYGCENFPKCKFATWDKPVDEPCPECSYSVMVVRTTRDRGTFLKCPKCGAEVQA